MANIWFCPVEMMQQFIRLCDERVLAFSVVTESVKPHLKSQTSRHLLIMAANSLFQIAWGDNNSSLTQTVKLIFSPAQSASVSSDYFFTSSLRLLHWPASRNPEKSHLGNLRVEIPWNRVFYLYASILIKFIAVHVGCGNLIYIDKGRYRWTSLPKCCTGNGNVVTVCEMLGFSSLGRQCLPNMGYLSFGFRIWFPNLIDHQIRKDRG